MSGKDIVRQVCEKFQITQKELAEGIDDFNILYDRLRTLIADRIDAKPIITIKLKRRHPISERTLRDPKGPYMGKFI